MKKCHSAILSLGTALMAALPALGWEGAVTDKGVKYWYEADDGSQTASIYLVENQPSGAVVVPSSIATKNGTYAVTTLAANAFLGQNITKVTIPASIENIGGGCFMDCAKLNAVVFEGRTGDDLDYGSVFENTPFLTKIMGFYNKMSIEYADFCIACQQRGSKADNNQYDTKEADPYTGDTYQKWYGLIPTASGNILIDTWKSDCDLVISAYKVTGSNDNGKPILTPVGFSTVTAESASGNVYFPVTKDETYYVCVEGTKSGPRRARGDFTLQWHFGKTPRKVTLNLHGGTLPCGVTSYFLPGGSGKVNYSTLGELPAPVRDGFIFSGWFLDSSYKTKATATTKIKMATTLHAKWSAKSFNLMVMNDTQKGKTVSVTGIPSAIKYRGKKTTLTGSMYVSAGYFCANTLTLAATAKPGYGFDRWIDVSEGQGASGTPSAALRKPSMNISMPPHDTIYQATYVGKDEDVIEFEDGPTAWYLEDGETNFLIRARSRTYPKKAWYSATKGLLDDVKQGWTYDGTYATMKLTANAKALKKTGVWTYKVAFTTQSGNAATNTITVYGRNSTAATESTQTSSASLNGLYTSCHDTPYTNMTVGVKYTTNDWALAGITANSGDGWRITSITGIPGLSWNRYERTLTGVPTKAGSFIATITVTKGSGKSSTSAKATALVVVAPLPEWAYGTFKGYTAEPLRANPLVGDFAYCEGSRPVTVTIGSTGKYTVNIDGAKFTGTGLERWVEESDTGVSFKGYTIHAKINGKGTGKDKNKITWEDSVSLTIDRGVQWYVDNPRNIYGRNERWRMKGNTTLPAVVSVSKKDFRMQNGEYLGETYLYGKERIGKLAHLLCYGTKDSDAMRVFCLSPGWVKTDEVYDRHNEGGVNTHTYLRMVDSDTYGLVPNLLIVNSVDGVATVFGSVSYHGKKYDMSGTAWVNLFHATWNSAFDYVRSGTDWHAVGEYGTMDDYDSCKGYFAVARIMKNGHALEIVWYLDYTNGTEPVLEKVEATFWP